MNDYTSTIAASIASFVALASFILSFLVHKRNRAPDVIAYLECNRDSGSVALVIKNAGRGVAYNIEFEGVDYTSFRFLRRERSQEFFDKRCSNTSKQFFS